MISRRLCVQGLGKLIQGRRAHQHAQRYGRVEVLAQAPGDAHRKQRMAAQGEEVAVVSERADRQELGPNGCNAPFRRRQRPGAFSLRRFIEEPQRQIGCGAAVGFAVGQQGNGVDRPDEAGHHRGRQLFAQVRTEHGAVGCAFDQGHEDRIRRTGRRDRQNDTPANALASLQASLHAVEIHALSADLDLPVAAAVVEQTAVFSERDQVAGGEDPAQPAVGLRHRVEAVLRQLGPLPIALGQAMSADQQLPRPSEGYRLERFVHHQESAPVDWPSDRNGTCRQVGGLDLMGGDVGRDLRRAVDVEQLAGWRDRKQTARRICRQHLSAGDDQAQAGKLLLPVVGQIQQRGEQRGHQGQARDAVTGQERQQKGSVGGDLLRGNHQPAPGKQRRQDLLHAVDETECGLVAEDIVRAGRQEAAHPVMPVQDAPACADDSLGFAGGARGIDDIGPVARPIPLRPAVGRLVRDAKRTGVDRDQVCRVLSEGRRRALDQKNAGATVCQDPGQKALRIARVQTDPGPARQQHAEDCRDLPARRRNEECDRLARRDALTFDGRCHRFGGRAQLSIGPGAIAVL